MAPRCAAHEVPEVVIRLQRFPWLLLLGNEPLRFQLSGELTDKADARDKRVEILACSIAPSSK